MLYTKIDDILKNGRMWVTTIRDRINQGLAGRSRQVVAMATLAGVALIGLVAATLDTTPQPNTSTASVQTQRSDAADRADRSIRDPQSAAAEAQNAAPAQAPEAVPAQTEAAPVAEVKKPDWVAPMDAPISSCFGPRWGTQHQGIDYAGNENANIHTVGAGEVVATGWVYTGYGISVVVDHGNGFLTHYAHLNKAAVSVGQKVSTGELIGYEGSTGDSTGPHLHFEVHKGMWNQVNPTAWLADRGVNIAGC